MAKVEPFEKYPGKYEDWFTRNKFVYESELRAIKDILPSFEKGIEIGVGSGRFAAPLGIKFGVEPSEKMRKIARKRGIEAVEGVGENLEFEDCSFDLALMVTTICFLNDVEKAFSEVYRILEPGGYFVVALVDRESRLGKIYKKHKHENVFYRQAKFHSARETIGYLKEAGFTSITEKQTVFGRLDEITCMQEPKDGFGEGSFVAIRGQKV
ncbi:MAG: class I SAM-dependent methyltransferase [Actinomycetota bacterium]